MTIVTVSKVVGSTSRLPARVHFSRNTLGRVENRNASATAKYGGEAGTNEADIYTETVAHPTWSTVYHANIVNATCR